MSLVERDGGCVRSTSKDATAKTLAQATARKVANRKSYLMTDENPAYKKTWERVFTGHGTVNHSANEYVEARQFHPHQYGRGLFLDLQARCDRRLSPHKRATS